MPARQQQKNGEKQLTALKRRLQPKMTSGSAWHSESRLTMKGTEALYQNKPTPASDS
jgi:hypothetical protein